MLKRLAEAHPESMVQLTYQYRMHEDICQLSNDLVYGGRLKCANEEVRRQQLQLPVLQQNLPQPEWLTIATDPTRPVVFLNTDSIHATSSEGKVIPEVALERTSGRGKGGSIVNDVEANLVRLVVQNLISRGLPPSSIGVVCPFRAQVRTH